tara:strand:- start:283 stop:555 length:273 start_codon:yes stop_codon:yes gene_type:complete
MSAEMRNYTIELERLVRMATSSVANSLASSVASTSTPAASVTQSDYIRVDTWSLTEVKQVSNRVAITRIDMNANGELFLNSGAEVGEIRF